MGDKTAIEWTDATWNPVTGCTRVSSGCDHCYIERTPPFRQTGRRFDGDGPGSTTGVLLHHDRLHQPWRWRKPRRVFVNSVSDLFHDAVPDDYIAQVFAVMDAAPEHIFQVLTKRPARMRSLLSSLAFEHAVFKHWSGGSALNPDERYPGWPLPNVHLGVSVEDQRAADLRIPTLLDTPAAVRFLSCEPLLGSIELVPEHLGGYPESDQWTRDRQAGLVPLLNWVIVGGESGPHARPMHPNWARSLRDQCAVADVPYFFKQWGEWAPPTELVENHWCDVWEERHVQYVHPVDGRTMSHGDWGVGDHEQGWAQMHRVGKKRAGRELDGRTWDEYPERPS
jgi:protein gp37